jgi:RNA-directed DNA polymerase
VILEQMAGRLGLPPIFIQNLALAASHEYKTYQVPKRRGGLRTIHHPSRRLKALQRWILRNVLERLPVHPAATAYRRGISTLDNAAAHVKSRYLLRLDFIDFFPSIKKGDIANYVGARPHLFRGWNSLDVDLLCRLVCRDGALTIGAPTSPALSNAICYDMDAQVETLCARSDVSYTRYADDLFFSARETGILRGLELEVAGVVERLPIPAGLRVNTAKTRHSSRRGRRRVTGIVLGSDGHAYIGRGLKRRVRALIYKYGSLDSEARSSLAGLLAYAIGLDPEFMNSLIEKYGLTLMRQVRTGGR